MKRQLPVFLIVVSFQLLLCGSTWAQSPIFNQVTPNSATIPRFNKFELNINLTAAYTNAYDYDDIVVQCIFTSPGGRKDTVDGFFMQEYNLNANNSLTSVGTGVFKVRYSPNETGSWSYVLSCKNSVGTTSRPAQTFECTASNAPGLIRRNTTNYLGFDNGSQYIPVGENMGWQNGNVVTDYTNWITKLASNNGNFIRVWMSSWAFAMEWKNGSNGFTGLKKYKQSNAFYLDWLLEYCREKGVYMMLALNNHGQVSTAVNPEWNDNPYNTVNGGPAANTWDFFSNASAKELHKNRLRYILARYGYSANIQSWELFNEVVWTDQFATRKNEITAWDNEMSTYIKNKDVYKHLVTTSYGDDGITTNTWSLPNIDFTQTHYYVNTSNIESVMASGTQNYLAAYSKPVLNGEFGLGPGGAALTAVDPNGIHLHNASWGSMFSGALGSGMSWWWDNYIEPQNLYYHFKPLASVVSLIDFKEGNYKRNTSFTTGGGASDITVSPGANYGAPTSSSFVIDATGAITPGAAQLGQYLFGNVYNTQNRNPPTFNVNYPVAGQFKIVTGTGTGTLPQLNVSVDGVVALSQSAAINTTYTINIPAGQHAIKVDNLGTDWIRIASYVFTNIGSPLTSYALKSADGYKASGWILNSRYNHQYVQTSGAPAPVAGSSLSIPGMQNGNYSVFFYSCSTGNLLSTTSAAVTNGTMVVALPSIAWDVAFRAIENNVLPINLNAFTGRKIKNTNELTIDIERSDNVKSVAIERSGGVTNFTTLSPVSSFWSSIAGRHIYIDAHPLKGDNFYRLKTTDKDGKETYSVVLRIANSLSVVQVYPNPFNESISLNITQGKYSMQVSDQNGKIVWRRSVIASGGLQTINLNAAHLQAGTYYLTLTDDKGNVAGYEKLIKQR